MNKVEGYRFLSQVKEFTQTKGLSCKSSLKPLIKVNSLEGHVKGTIEAI